MRLRRGRPGLALLGVLVLAASCSSVPSLERSSPSPSPAEPPRAASPTRPPMSSAEPSGSPSPEPSPEPSAGSSAGSLPPYDATVRRLDAVDRDRLRWSHRPGCPVPLADLRLLEIDYVGFDGAAHRGELVVHEDVAADIVAVFDRLYAARWPIRRMRLVDEYAGDDDRSMAADNTSAYNCRRVAGTSRWSEHAYGRAVDLNPVENPYVREGVVQPESGRRYAALDRSPGATLPPGVIGEGDVVVRAFTGIGWKWGGRWTSAKDWQHFSRSGR